MIPRCPNSHNSLLSPQLPTELVQYNLDGSVECSRKKHDSKSISHTVQEIFNITPENMYLYLCPYLWYNHFKICILYFKKARTVKWISVMFLLWKDKVPFYTSDIFLKPHKDVNNLGSGYKAQRNSLYYLCKFPANLNLFQAFLEEKLSFIYFLKTKPLGK